MSVSIAVRRGAVHIPAEVAAAHFAGVEAVAVIVRDGRLWVMPVHHVGAGGCLLKLRNAAGDRVAVAADVFAAHGLADWSADPLAAHWSAQDGALVAALTAN